MTSRLIAAAKPAATRWAKLAWLIPGALALLCALVLLAQWLRHLPAVREFILAHPGASPLPDHTPAGFPPWLGWQHFFNALVILLLMRSGWQVRTTRRPEAYWTRNNDGALRTRNLPRKISLELWFHLNLATLFTINGVIFYLLLFTTGQWKRLIPTDWEVFPDALSVALQYASMDWPTENGWVNYNALQVLAYFATVFVAAPLAIITGVRMSGMWPARGRRLNRLYPIEIARTLHFPVLVYFVLFIVVHVTLVLATGARANLNHMYAMRDDASWIGLAVCAVSLVVIVVAWVAAQPIFLRPVAARTGTLSKK